MMANYEKLELEDPDDANTPLLVIKPIQRSKKKGCCSCCLKLCCIIFVGFVALFFIASAGIYIQSRKIVRSMTVSTPKAAIIPAAVDIPLAKLDEVKNRIISFIDTIRAGKVPKDDFVITEEEMNGFLGHSDYLRGKLYLSLNNDENKNEIRTLFSFPTDGLPGGTGRYFVGSEVIDIDRKAHQISIDLNVDAYHETSPGTPSLVMAVFRYALNNNSFEKKHLNIYLQNLKLLGVNKAEGFIAKHENLLKDFYDDPDISRVAEQIDSITVENNSIVVKPRRDNVGTTRTKIKDIIIETESEPTTRAKTMLRKPPTLP